MSRTKKHQRPEEMAAPGVELEDKPRAKFWSDYRKHRAAVRAEEADKLAKAGPKTSKDVEVHQARLTALRLDAMHDLAVSDAIAAKLPTIH